MKRLPEAFFLMSRFLNLHVFYIYIRIYVWICILWYILYHRQFYKTWYIEIKNENITVVRQNDFIMRFNIFILPQLNLSWMITICGALCYIYWCCGQRCNLPYLSFRTFVNFRLNLVSFMRPCKKRRFHSDERRNFYCQMI